MSKTREFYIQNPQFEICTATKVSAFDPEVNPQITEEVHVIEKSAYDKQQAIITRLLAALEFYANLLSWEDENIVYVYNTILDSDCDIPEGLCDRRGGKRAREEIAKAKRDLREV